ncbi:MAG: hypothetical protein E6G27_18875 [Actinobacteria bacterium]|nr:MAG: hypothetical protein E6G27_18875 [Actinomycetota bacterium]
MDGELDPARSGSRVARHVAERWDCSVGAEATRLIKAALRSRRRPPQLSGQRLRRFVAPLFTS